MVSSTSRASTSGMEKRVKGVVDTMNGDQSYNSDALQVLDGLDPVRKRPNMYTETTRPNHMVQEPIDNSIDEALAGHATEVSVTLHKDGSVTVADDGNGNNTIIVIISAPFWFYISS